jgi:general secretion pathway protein K
MELEFGRFYQRGANILLSEQASAYLRGAEDLAKLALLADYDRDQNTDPPRDDLNEIWAQATGAQPVEEGVMLGGSLADLQGRFNLNTLGLRESGEEGAPRFTAAQAQFIRLLQALAEPPVSEQEAIVITEAVGDWLDRDQEPLPNGAEDDYYFAMSPAYRAANRPMASVSELRSVANVTPDIYRALEPWVTVWPQQPTSLNIHTAPAMVLRSLNADDELQPLSFEDGQMLVEQRAAIGFADVDDFIASGAFAGKSDKMEKAKSLLGQNSKYFLLSATGEVADRKLRLYSVLERNARQITVVVRAGGSL